MRRSRRRRRRLRTASCAATGHRREPCAVLVARSRRPGNPAAAGAAACRRRYRADRPGRPQSACGGAGRRTDGRCDLEPAAGSAAGARQSGARAAAMPKDVRGDDVTVHTNTPPPPFRGALPAAQPVASPSIAPDAPLATDRASSARRHRCRHCAANPAAGGLAAGPHRRFGAEDRYERAALEFRDSVCDAAGHGDGAVRDFPRWRRRARSRPPSGSGGRASRSTSSRPGRSMRWCR